MSTEKQDFKHHARIDPFFHGVCMAIYLANLAFAAAHFSRHRDWMPAWYLFMSIVVAVPLFKIRLYALKVQDRVIRLEERLRLQALAPAEWHEQIFKLTEDQLIGLRFAADDEVVELAKQALEHKLNRKQIKERIKSWRADNWRV